MTNDKARGAVQQAWLTANPDLRMGSPSVGWQAALVEASERARADVARVRAPVRLLYGGQDRLPTPAILASTCAALADCRTVALPAGHHDLHMESDAVRDAWLVEIERFIKVRIAAKAQRHNG